MVDWKFLGGITALGGLIGYFGAKTIDVKKLPAGEKAVLTGASTGATMEGLETLLAAESFSASEEYLEVMVDSSSLDELRNSDFGNGLTMDVNDIQGSILSLDYGEGGDEAVMPADEAKKDYMNQIGITTYDFDDDNVDDEDDWNTDKRVWRGTINFPEGKQGEGGEFYASVIGFTTDDENTYEKQIMNHILNTVRLMPVRYRDDEDNQFYYAESFNGEAHTDRIRRLKREIEDAQKELRDVEYCGHEEWNSINGWTNQDPFSLTVECAECGSHGLAEYDEPTELSWDKEYLAESLKKDSCCCGATKSNPCACMIQGVMKCSATCPCALEN